MAPHDHLARVEPDADLHGRAARALELVRVEGDPPLHAERGVAGADRVVLVGDRRPEQRHDAVAHHLVDGALVVMDGLHHPLEDRVEELPRLLGVPVGEQLHRPLRSAKSTVTCLRSPFEGGLRGEDLLGEVLGGVGLGRCEPSLTPAAAPTGCPHSRQNFAPEGRSVARIGRISVRNGPALQQNFAWGWVLVLAPGTRHRAPGAPRLA